MAGGNFGGGRGTRSNPFIVEDAYDLDAVRNNTEAFYKQTKDIDLSEYGNWRPIGLFSGGYDGGEKAIIGLTIQQDVVSAVSQLGLFSDADGATLTRINLRDVSISYSVNGMGAIVHCGCIVGKMDGGTLTHSSVIGTVSFTEVITADYGGSNVSIGGLVGLCSNSNELYPEPAIKDCYTDVTVYLSSFKDQGGSNLNVGGLCGTLYNGNISTSYSAGDMEIYLEGDHSLYEGGIVGDYQGINPSMDYITRCYSLGSLRINDTDVALYLVYMRGEESTISECFSLDGPDIGVELVTIQEAKSRKHYEANGWDFENVWGIKETKGFPTFDRAPIYKTRVMPIEMLM